MSKKSNNNISNKRASKDSKRNVTPKIPKKDKSWISILYPRNKCQCCLYVTGALFLAAGFLMLRVYLSYQTFIERQNRNISDILSQLVEYANELQTLELQCQKALMVDPFADLVEQQVMPVQEKMSSIRAQLKIYENMERASGGPTNFMEQNFRDINYIEDKIHDFERQYGLILVNMRKELDYLHYESRNIYTKLMKIVDDSTLEKLRTHDIYLDDPALEFRSNPPKTFDEVVELITELASLFAKWEVPKTQIKQLIKNEDLNEYPESLNDEDSPLYQLLQTMLKHQTAIDLFLMVNGQYIRLIFMYIEQQVLGFRKFEEDIVTMQTKCKMRYDRLTEMLTDDIFNTRERVKNLRYANKKFEL